MSGFLIDLERGANTFTRKFDLEIEFDSNGNLLEKRKIYKQNPL